MKNKIMRGFVRIAEGEVHYRYCGDFLSTRPLVMLHPSPASAVTLLPLMRRLAGTRPLLAPDTLGNGDSAPAFQAVPKIADYAEALGRVLDTLGVGEIDLYGSHTGASIAAELAIAQPDRVRRLLIDGIGLYSEEELKDILAHYAPAVEPDALGNHLNWTWHFVRDQNFFFPWFKRDAEHRRKVDCAPADILHGTVLEVLKSLTTYHHAYRAAFHHPKHERLPLVKTRALVFGEPTDPLNVVQDEVCRLLPGGEKANLSRGDDGMTSAKADVITEYLERDEADERKPFTPGAPFVAPNEATRIDRSFAAIAEGQIHLRLAGGRANGDDTPVVVLHSSPYSARTIEPMIRALAPARRVIAPDLPGLGDSVALNNDSPGIADYADAIGRALDAMGIASCDVCGTHTGGTVAMELAIARPELVRNLIIDGIGLYAADFQAEIVANYAPEMAPDDMGRHINWAWHFVRDHNFFWPWYARDAAHARDAGAPPPAELHANVVDLLKAITTFHHAFRSTFSHPKRERLPKIPVRTLFIGRSTDPKSSSEAEAAGLVKDAALAVVAAGEDAIAAKAKAIVEFAAG